jgi:hypothetical protein
MHLAFGAACKLIWDQFLLKFGSCPEFLNRKGLVPTIVPTLPINTLFIMLG